MLDRLKSLAVQCSNGTYSDVDREQAELEYRQLMDEIDNIAWNTDFNGIYMLDGGRSTDSTTAALKSAGAVMTMGAPLMKSMVTLMDYGMVEKSLDEIQNETLLGATAAQTININNVQNGDSGDGWNFTDGVLNITGNNGQYEIVGNGVETSNVVKVANGLKVELTLNNVNIKSDSAAAVDGGNSDMSVILTGNNILTATHDYNAALQTINGKITIDGVGKLTAEGGRIFDAIGSASGTKQGNGFSAAITINSGTIIANANEGAAIGSGYYGDAAVTINGGKITATNDERLGSAIGNSNGDNSIITINGGIIIANSREGFAIGFSNFGGRCTVTINDGIFEIDGDIDEFTYKNGNFYVTRPICLQFGLYDSSGNNLYMVNIDGLNLNPYQTVSYTVDDKTYNVTANSNGKIYLLLPETSTEKTMKITADGVDYEGNYTVATNHEGSIIMSKLTAPDPDPEPDPDPNPDPPPVKPSEAKVTDGWQLILQVSGRSSGSASFGTIPCTDSKHIGDPLVGTTSIVTQQKANDAIDIIDTAVNQVSNVRAMLGAIQNRLEHKLDNLGVTYENITAAESRIRDTDMAKEMMNFTKMNILSSASQSMLAQANLMPQEVMKLLN